MANAVGKNQRSKGARVARDGYYHVVYSLVDSDFVCLVREQMEE